jgi:hypothetical protein
MGMLWDGLPLASDGVAAQTTWVEMIRAQAGAVTFDREKKEFWREGVRLRTVTEAVGSLSPEFDRDGISRRVAERRGVAQETVLAEWEAKATAGKERGKLVHAFLEAVAKGESPEPTTPETHAALAAWAWLKSERRAAIELMEAVVSCLSLRLVGRIDWLITIATPTARIPCVVDFKTGKYAHLNRYDRMLPPFEDQPKCEHVAASLQTSLYRLILDGMGIVSADPLVIHLDSSGTFSPRTATDFRGRLKQWLKT